MKQILLVVVWLAPLSAAVITDPSQMTGSQSVVDFSGFSGTFKSRDLGQGVFFEGGSTSGPGVYPAGWGGSYFGTPTSDLGLNGQWNEGRGSYWQMRGVPGTVAYWWFDGPVASVGMVLNHSRTQVFNPNISLAIYDQNRQRILDWPLSALSICGNSDCWNTGRFEGWDAGANVIYGFSVSDSGSVVGDNLTFSRIGAPTAETPEPGTFGMLGGALVAVGALRRKAKLAPLNMRRMLARLRGPKREHVDAMKKVLDQMDGRQRLALLRYYVDNRTEAEICEEFGVAPDWFRAAKFEARSRFAASIRKPVEGGLGAMVATASGQAG